MIFQEFYGAYYNSIAKILTEAVKAPISSHNLHKIINDTAFSESVIFIEDALKNERWPLLFADGTTPINHTPAMPLTIVQKRWLKSMLLDVRIRLFLPDYEEYLLGLTDIEPLFTVNDYRIFDQYADGDPYTDEKYIDIFRIILDALEYQYPLKILMRNSSGRLRYNYVKPDYLEYSEKDDKFRLIASDGKMGRVINLARIESCEKYDGSHMNFEGHLEKTMCEVTIELVDERNTLERALLHFAHFEKSVKQLDEKHYRIDIIYDYDDESELVIRILSFGPMLKVISPDSFIELIKERLKKQMQTAL